MRSVCLAALALVLGACDASPEAPPGELAPNTFALRVGDGEPVTRRGAFVGSYVSEATGQPTVAVLLGTGPIASALALEAPAVGFVHDGAEVSAGAHALVPVAPDGPPTPDAFVGFYFDPSQYVAGGSPPAGFYFTGGGALQIDALDTDGARGSFTMEVVEYAGDAAALAPSAGAAVTVSGTFHAVRSDAFGGEGSLLGRRPSWLRWLPVGG